MRDWLVSLALAVIVVTAIVTLVYHTVPILFVLFRG
jgi:hypothetical protein